MDDLITWLRTQLDEDERIAKAASEGPWRANDDTYPEAIYAAEHGEVVSGGRWGGEARCFDSDEDVWHIVRHDPARVLREVEAKRAILGDIQMCQACGIGRRCVPHDASFGEPVTRPAHPDDEQLVRLLAAPYSDRPGYREEWKP